MQTVWNGLLALALLLALGGGAPANNYIPYVRLMQFDTPITAQCGQTVVVPLALHWPEPGEGKYRLRVVVNGDGDFSLWPNLGPVTWYPICCGNPREAWFPVTYHPTADQLSVVLRGAQLQPCSPTLFYGELEVLP